MQPAGPTGGVRALHASGGESARQPLGAVTGAALAARCAAHCSAGNALTLMAEGRAAGAHLRGITLYQLTF
jgi:hypothetical protein